MKVSAKLVSHASPGTLGINVRLQRRTPSINALRLVLWSSAARIRSLRRGDGENVWKHAVHEGFAARETTACDADAALDRHDDEGDASVP
jgi:hypothetical protein